MKAYNKYEVDEIFSSWQSDLDRLDEIEVYTKSDIVAMLTEIQLEIAELPAHVVSNQKSIIRMEIAPSAEDVYEIIQQKINSLKEVKDGENNY